MVVQTIAPRKIKDMNFATDLVHRWDICVRKKSSTSMESPNPVEKSCLSYKHDQDVLSKNEKVDIT